MTRTTGPSRSSYNATANTTNNSMLAVLASSSPRWRRRRHHRQWCWTCGRIALVTGVIPLVFVVRLVRNRRRPHPELPPTLLAPGIATASIENKNNNNNNPQQQQASDRSFLQGLDFSTEYNLYDSDVVELHHCNMPHTTTGTNAVTTTDNDFWNAFFHTAVVDRFLDPAVRELERTAEQHAATDAFVLHNTNTNNINHFDENDMRNEFLLELLEQYLQQQPKTAIGGGGCNYTLYRPTVVHHDAAAAQLLRAAASVPTSSASAASSSSSIPNPQQQEQPPYRLAFVISAFQDVPQLMALLAAIYQPQHFIVIHLERHCPSEYRTRVQEAIATLSSSSSFQLSWNDNNVVLVQFGTVVYRTDSLSMINFRILRWMTVDLQLPYEQILLMDASVFPLVSPSDLVSTLHRQATNEGRSVWLGELTHQGQGVSASACPRTTTNNDPVEVVTPVDHWLRQKRLIFTRHNNLKLHKRLPKDTWDENDENSRNQNNNTNPLVPTKIRNHLLFKSTSGNQGIYSRHVVQKMIESDVVMELFALSKYACCCCVEERNWIAALDIVGFGCEAMEHSTSMFQVWGGESETCMGSMKNAVLKSSTALCYRSEDPGYPRTNGNTVNSPDYFTGDAMWDRLVDARRRGALFARKFQSDHAESVELRQAIQNTLWTAPFET